MEQIVSRIKPVIIVSCLPELSERKLNEIYRELVKAIEDAKEFAIHDEESLVVIFPSDSMKYGLGTEIIVEGKWFPENDEVGEKEWMGLAFWIGMTIQKFFEKSFVQCVVGGFSGPRGFWTSFVPDPSKIQEEVGISVEK